MSGGLMQIVAQGAQDKYLTVDPEITFFKSMYRRHTNFATESIEQTFNGNVTSGGKVSATISRNGDLVHTMWLELTLPSIAGLSADPADTSEDADVVRAASTMYDIIDNIYIEIGGTRVDRHYSTWMRVHDELWTENGGKRDNLDDVVNIPAVTKADLWDGAAKPYPSIIRRVPLSFWFCTDAGQALPLIALQYHEVKVNVEFKTLEANSKVSLWVDYVYLDTAERQRFARSAHEYLIQQVQTTNQESLSGTSDKIRLNFNHPVKELVWTLTGSGSPTLVKAKLQLNGHDRFTERDGDYFEKVQQYQYHTNASAGTYVYSFALEPEKLQPSGSCNFSRIDNAELSLESSQSDSTTEIFATNYNVLRIKNGMGGLAYSN